MTQHPPWLERIDRLHQTRAATAFLLYFNVNDLVPGTEHEGERLLGALQGILAGHGFTSVVRYSLSQGIVCPTGRGLVSEQARAAGIGDLASCPPEQAIPFIERLAEAHGDERVAIVIEHLEHIAPAGASDRGTRAIVETLQRIASSERVEATANLVIALTPNVGAVSAAITAADSGWMQIRVDLPRVSQRRDFLDRIERAGLLPRLEGFELEDLAELTGGFRLVELRRLLRESLAGDGALTLDAVVAREAELVRAESEGLLTVLPSRHGFDAVGGHEPVKCFVRSLMRNGRLDPRRAPGAILFVGPPGTGKTHLAEAIAAECGMVLASMGEIRSRWVGESERNIARVLDVVEALAPIVVFIDEIDQALGRRDEGASGDSGVSGRIFSRILQFMGDPRHRGKVLWIAATNRPDLLDRALLRRFGRVFPFLLPAASERERILHALAARTPERFAPDVDWREVAERAVGSSGSALEVVLSRAEELVEEPPVRGPHLDAALRDFRSNIDRAEYRRQSLAALDASNFYSDWPEELPEDLAEELRGERPGLE